ncbi:hypothetical protein PC9H_010981 [Pleurotus ostreatus]|uniref:Uncharacterized protein n=1 Tax=Pleurotus ostreatus TaxID=5322 RepID=A0A8H6ZKT3_PLEOS|nr:uncharacterized protein PC9H_010981 [Pleurotus ostreatus]KAF7422822.1 hypothetical protein PC9H_010981 [Pleurotus ostreatus]KAJ8691226.1 hypothetical protein PTI98_010822 [Pleurotus ostreatus]
MNSWLLNTFDSCDPRVLPVCDGGIPPYARQDTPVPEGVLQHGFSPLVNTREPALPDALKFLVHGKSAIDTVYEALCKTNSDNGCSLDNLLDIHTSDESFPIEPNICMSMSNSYETGFIAQPMFDNAVRYDVPQSWPVPPPDIATIPSASYQRSYAGGKRGRERYKEHLQSSPYNRTQRQHAANSEWWYGGDTAYPPPEPPSSLRQSYREDTVAQNPGSQNGASPNGRTFRNRDSGAKVTFDFGLPSPADSTASSNGSSGSSVDSRKSRKHHTDNVRSKAINNARNRLKALFPSRKLVDAEETAVRVCKYILSTRIVPEDEGEVQRWWSNLAPAATSPSESGKAQAGALPEDKDARRRELKRRSDGLRHEATRALNNELRALFGPSGSLVDTMDLAYDFLVHAKERRVVPDMTAPAWREECAVTAGPFFEKTK